MSIEDRYLSGLVAVQYPDAPVAEPTMDGMQLAAGPTQTVSDAGGGMGEIKPIPRNTFQQAIGKLGEIIQSGAEKIDFDVVGLPGIGSLTLKDLTVGDLGKVLQDISYGFYPIKGGNAATGGIGTYGLKPDPAMELLNAAPVVGAAGKAAAKGTVKAGKALAPKAAEMAVNAAEKTGMPVRGLGIVEQAPSLGKVVTPDQIETPNFKNWFGDWQAAPESASKVVDETGAPKVVYHGTARPDRVGANFRKSRATSGPMSFFTDDPDIASGYAKGKQDTSLAYEETDYANWFKKKDGRSTINLDQAGARMSPSEKQAVIEKLRNINMTDEGEIVYQPGGGTIMSDSSFDFYLQREAKGNPLKLAKQLWLESGQLYNQEEQFSKVLQLAGVKGFDADFPTSTYPFVYKVFLDIKKPLDTSAIPSEIVADLEATASRIRKRPQSGGADMWDKNTIAPKDWIERLKGDIKDGTTHAWTSIPDWVTDRLKANGFDGIKDIGGKQGGATHAVWIPFEETQVKSAIGNRGTFDPTKKNILHGAGAGTAGTAATMQDKEKK